MSSFRALPTTASSSVSGTRIKPVEGSIDVVVQMVRFFPGKATSISKPNVMTPSMLSFVTASKVVVPYVFVKPKIKKGESVARNLVDENFKVEDLIIEPGCETHMVSLYTKLELHAGSIYRLEGVHLEAFLGMVTNKETKMEEMMTKPSIRLKCSFISTVSDITPKRFMAMIPFANRSVDFKRDVPGEDTMAYLALAEGESHRNQYLHVDLCGPEPNDEPGNSRGSFPELAPGVVAEHSYTPFDAVSNVSLPPMLALGGGRAGDVVQKAQFYIRQVEETGEIHLYRGYTRVYADAGLNDLQMDWKSVFNVIPTHIRGDVICTIDRPGSAYFECPDAKDYDGNFVLNTVLIPDMKATIQNWGFRVDWNTVATIDTRLSKPEMMIWAGYSVNLRECTALNVLQYNGNCSLLVEAESLGWIEFYLGCNMPIAGEAREEMLKLDSKTLLTQITGNFKKYYATIQPYYAVFACPTATCPCGIADLVALKGKPIGAMLITEAKNSKKKMRIEEEGDEEEEE